MAREKLGEILIRAGLLDEFGLQRALNEQQRWGGQLGRYLVELGLITEETLVRALSAQYKLPAVTLDPQKMNTSVARLIPKDICERNGVICFHADPKKKFLDIAMSDPSNADAIDEVRVATRYNVRPHIAAPTVIDKAISFVFYGDLSFGDELELTSNSGYHRTSPTNDSPKGFAPFSTPSPAATSPVVPPTPNSRAWSSELKPLPATAPPALEVQVTTNKPALDEVVSPAGAVRPSINLPSLAQEDAFHITLDIPAVDKAVMVQGHSIEERLDTLEYTVKRNSTLLQLLLEGLLRKGFFTQEEIARLVKLQS